MKYERAPSVRGLLMDTSICFSVMVHTSSRLYSLSVDNDDSEGLVTIGAGSDGVDILCRGGRMLGPWVRFLRMLLTG